MLVENKKFSKFSILTLVGVAVVVFCIFFAFSCSSSLHLRDKFYPNAPGDIYKKVPYPYPKYNDDVGKNNTGLELYVAIVDQEIIYL